MENEDSHFSAQNVPKPQRDYAAFLSYSTGADYKLAIKLEEFLEGFHQEAGIREYHIKPLKICADGSDFTLARQRPTRSTLEERDLDPIKTLISRYLALSEALLVLWPGRDLASAFMDWELQQFLDQNRRFGWNRPVFVAVTRGDEPASNPDGFFSDALCAAGLHRDIFYDLRGRHPTAPTWKKVRDFDRERMRLAVDLRGPVDSDGRALAVDDIIPGWRREQEKSRRRTRNIAIGAAIVFGILALFATLAAFEANHQRGKAVKSRNEAEDVLEFLAYDLSRDLEKAGNTGLREKVQRRVKDYFTKLGTEPTLQATLHNRCATLNQEGRILTAKGKLLAAQAVYEQSWKLANRLAASDPTNMVWQFDLALSLESLGDIYMARSDLESARAHYEESLKISSQLAANSGNDPQRLADRCIAFVKLGDVCAAQQDIRSAQGWYKKASEGFERLSIKEPKDPVRAREFGVSLSRLGNFDLDQAQLASAKAKIERSLQISERLLSMDSGNAVLQHDLAAVLQAFGDLSMAETNLSQAFTNYTKSFKWFEALAARDPQAAKPQWEFAASYEKLGDLNFSKNDFLSAQSNFDRCLEIREKWSDPANAQEQHDLNVAFSRLGDVYFAQNDLPRSQTNYLRAWHLAKNLAAAAPGSPLWQDDLAVAHTRLGIVAAQPDEAKKHYSAALDIYNHLCARYPDNATWQKHVSVLQELIADPRAP
jgi:tetratricopeptide (TPR) repeat protein